MILCRNSIHALKIVEIYTPALKRKFKSDIEK